MQKGMLLSIKGTNDTTPPMDSTHVYAVQYMTSGTDVIIKTLSSCMTMLPCRGSSSATRGHDRGGTGRGHRYPKQATPGDTGRRIPVIAPTRGDTPAQTRTKSG